MSADRVRSLIIVSDLHCGCRTGLCPPEGVVLADGGGRYVSSPTVQKMWSWWREFWDEWVPRVTHGEPYDVVVNGDAVDGRHHGSVHQVSQNLADQQSIAYSVLKPIADRCADGGGRLYMVKGTEAHVGQSGENEETLAQRLGAVQDKTGAACRYELWKRVGGSLVHIMHHIGTTGASAYESTAVYRELVESYVEAGRWGDRPPDAIVRSHRHRHFETKIAAARGRALAVVTPGWQLKTPFTFKVPGGRVSQPQVGGVCLRAGDDSDENLYAREKIFHLDRPEAE